MSQLTKEDLKKKIQDLNIEFIRLQFTDVFGAMKSVSVTSDELDSAMAGELMFDGSSIDGFARVEESDQVLIPDTSTFNVMPWRPSDKGVASLVCDVYNPDGTPFEGCPRNILKSALKECQDMGYRFNVGPEGEFFLFHTDEKGRPVFDIHDTAGYFDLAPYDMGEDARRNIILTMKKMGFKIEASHHEVAPGQHEIDFKYDEALRTADNWMTFKDIVKNVANNFGLYATFLPKPFSSENGNAMHCNQSLYTNGSNAFYDPNNKENKLSDIAYYYIGGLLNHAKGMTLISNPIINSYKRLLPGYEAPTTVAWSTKNRTTLVRVPASRGKSTRVELRNPDPIANPYLVFAVMLKAGLEGVKNKIKPPSEIEKNIFDMSSKERNKLHVDKLPRDLYEAIEEMEKDSLVKEALGEHVFNLFIKAKRKEWNDYARHVHKWEIDNYLAKY
ncbi:type I glutamate--ammonia ligase [Natranaerobius trueperi]|uniref:Glutamine synthetase n=1 Tax=Natranaerobius trueperi TaxID=759412 RepID=A0A226BVH3_9FIRM|nr:type I glutamate--ammonia ligase [Natranaerobius trueperi]OWZ82996.1 type I glutamate--ammonia ligase [Natranaerobius trueperi]